MSRMTRRTFLAGTAAAGATMLLPHSRVLGANDDIRVGVVGFRGKGRQHIGVFKKLQGVRVVALCDADQAVIDKQVAAFKKDKQSVETYTDYRRMLENKDIDAIVTATPNHWHSLVTVWACQAGKDVYVEKPVCHNIFEGRKMVEAAAKYNRIVQSGTQSRSDVGLRPALKYIHEGKLGKIKVVRGFCYKRRASIGKVSGPQKPPETVDYNMWCGPAPMKPLLRKNLHYDWHWVWDTGSGDIGNQGIHEMDMCRWALGADELPPAVLSIGGRLGYDDDGETANTQIAIFDYAKAPVIFEVRGLPAKADSKSMDNYRGTRVGIVVECEDGYFSGGGGGGWVYDNDGKKVKQFKGDGGGKHQQNFIDCVRSRKTENLNANVTNGFLSSAMCHMGNISHRVGAAASQGEIREQIRSNPAAMNSYDRVLEHLAANNVNVKKTPLTLGKHLTMDTQAERFCGEHAAEGNEYISRDYRKPFVVPDKV